MSGPVLVTGADRSGTSLLYALLASHPNISMVRRSNMFSWFHGRFGDLADPDNLDRCLATIARYERLAPLDIDEERLRQELAHGPVTYGRLFTLMHQPRAERLGRARWGDKSLHTEHYADAVFAELPDARMIQVVRDPRDRHASVTKRYADVDRHVGPVTGRWLSSVRAGERNVRAYPDRYRMIRFEDLVRAPEEVLQEVCDLIDEPYVDTMLAMDGDPDHETGNSSFESFSPGTISTSAVGRYVKVLDQRDIAFIEAVTAGPLRRLGYLAAGERRTRIAVRDVPYAASNAARMVAWMVNDPNRSGRGRDVPDARLSAEASA